MTTEFRNETSVIFVVDTNQYAGNFERELVAYMTGRLGDCNVGSEEALEFYQDMGLWGDKSPPVECWEDLRNPFDFIIPEADDHGCFRPATICPSPGPKPQLYNSVACFMSRCPNSEETKLLAERAYQFAEKTKRNPLLVEPIAILGFRIVNKTVVYQAVGFKSLEDLEQGFVHGAEL